MPRETFYGKLAEQDLGHTRMLCFTELETLRVNRGTREPDISALSRNSPKLRACGKGKKGDGGGTDEIR